MKNKIKTLQINNKLLIVNGKDPLRYVDLETNKLYQYPDGQIASEVVLETLPEPLPPINDKQLALDQIAEAIKSGNYEFRSRNSIWMYVIDDVTNVSFIEVNWKVYNE